MGYSRLRSPFHLQLPFCLDPSPGEHSPPSTSASSSSSSRRGVRARLMPSSEAGTRARAHSGGLWQRGRSHARTCHSQLHKEGPKQQQQGFCSPPSLGTLAPGHDTGSLLGWRWWGEQAHTHLHTHTLQTPACPPAPGRIGIILARSTVSQTVIPASSEGTSASQSLELHCEILIASFFPSSSYSSTLP